MGGHGRLDGKTACALGVWMVLFVAAPPVHATSAVSLVWEAPRGCPTAETIAASVDKLVRHAPGAPLDVAVRVIEKGGRYSADVQTPTGQRSLEGETCRAVAETIVVILALAIDPDAEQTPAGSALLEEPTATPAPPPAPAPRTSPVTRRPPAPPSPAPPPRAAPAKPIAPMARWGGSGAMLMEYGMLPRPSVGPELSARLSRGIWSGEMRADALLPQSGTLPDDPARGGDLWWAGAYLGACVRTAPLRHCVGLEAGSLVGTGTGVKLPDTGYALWMAPRLDTGLDVELVGNWTLETRLEIAVPAHRPRFVLDQYGPVYRARALSTRGVLGLSWH
jgi:hypothetical protein